MNKKKSKYDWQALKLKGKLFKGNNLTPNGRIAYLKGIIQRNPLSPTEMKIIEGVVPFPRRGMQGMRQEEWQKALKISNEFMIFDSVKQKIVFCGKYSNYLREAIK